MENEDENSSNTENSSNEECAKLNIKDVEVIEPNTKKDVSVDDENDAPTDSCSSGGESGDDEGNCDHRKDVNRENLVVGGPKDPFMARVQPSEISNSLKEAVDNRSFRVAEVGWKYLGRSVDQVPVQNKEEHDKQSIDRAAENITAISKPPLLLGNTVT